MKNEHEAFPLFWDMWRKVKRRNDGRGDARKVFHKHVLAGIDPQEIIDGARAYIRKLPSGYEYVPLAATWLNRETFADYAEEERAYRAKLEESRTRSQENVVQMPERRVKTAYMLSWERQHGKDYFEHFDEQKRRAGE